MYQQPREGRREGQLLTLFHFSQVCVCVCMYIFFSGGEVILVMFRAFWHQIFIFTLLGLWNWNIHIWCSTCVSFILSSSRDKSLLSYHTYHLFLICFPCGPQTFVCGCHIVALWNTWIQITQYEKQKLGGLQDLCQNLNCLCQSKDSLSLHKWINSYKSWSLPDQKWWAGMTS